MPVPGTHFLVAWSTDSVLEGSRTVLNVCSPAFPILVFQLPAPNGQEVRNVCWEQGGSLKTRLGDGALEGLCGDLEYSTDHVFEGWVSACGCWSLLKHEWN